MLIGSIKTVVARPALILLRLTISTWRSENRLVSSRSSRLRSSLIQAVAISSPSGNPDYTKNESRNYNAISVADLAGQPQEEPGNAVPTALAVAYANSSVSPLTPVYYFLGPGFYDSTDDRNGHVFEHRCRFAVEFY